MLKIAWYADLVLVPYEALTSSDSAPPKTLRILAVAFCACSVDQG